MSTGIFRGIKRKIIGKPRQSETTSLFNEIQDVIDIKNRVVLLKNGKKKTLTQEEISEMAKRKPYPRGLTSTSNYLFWLKNYVFSSSRTWTNYQQTARINKVVPKMNQLKTDEERATALAKSEWNLRRIVELAELIRSEEERKREEEERKKRLEAQQQQAQYDTPIWKFTRYSKYLQLGAPYTDECKKILDDLTLEEENALLDQLLSTRVLGVYFSNDKEGVGSSQRQASILFVQNHLAKREANLKR